MIKLRALLKKIYQSALRLAWLIGGQKEHGPSECSVPPGGFIGNDAVLVFPEHIALSEGVILMSGARLICARMPPYLEPAGRIEIGEGSIIREGAFLQSYGGQIRVGKNCTINPYCLIQGNGGVQIGDNSLIASHVCMYSANHVFSDSKKLIRQQGETQRGITIGADVWIGGGAIILDGVTVGDGAVIAAGAVVKHDVAAGAVVAGVPARMISQRGNRL